MSESKIFSVRLSDQIVKAYKTMPKKEASLLRKEVKQLVTTKSKKYVKD